MRNAINENRSVQLALLAVLALVGGFMLLKAKGGSETTATAEPAATSEAPADGTLIDPTTGQAVDPTTGLPVASTTAATSTPVPASLVPGPGLPKSLLTAYRNGDAIVLLVRRAGGRDDRLVHDSVELLGGLPSVDVNVTNARHISRYTWLTQAVNVTDLPALVVLRPRKLTKGVPTASVSYGFRDAPSVLQAVEDGLYRGPSDRPYHP